MKAEVYNYLCKTIPSFLISIRSKNDQTSLIINHSYILEFFSFLKNHIFTSYKMMMDITAVDFPSRPLRFEVVYNLLSIKYGERVRVKFFINEITSVCSVTSIFSSAGWWEREVWDMFGIFFSNHPDLRRILTDYGFVGYPLKKDFPLTGYVEVKYDDSEKRVIESKVEITQEFRYFDFQSPWEQIRKIS